MRPVLLIFAALILFACTRSNAPSAPATEAKAPLETAKPSAPAPADAPPPAAPAPSDSPAPVAEEWTAGIVDVVKEGAPITLKEIRTARNEGFDRMVYVFAGSELPGYHLEYIDRPAHHCGSGAPLDIAGDALLEVRLRPAVAHDEQGELTIAAQEIVPKLPILLELEQSCDFEGVTSFVAGVKSPHRFRVLELKDPTRLVVDIRH